MRTHTKPLSQLTAEDLMTADVIVIPESMPVRDAVRLLFEKQIGGAPVVDTVGRCVGVISRSDFARLGLRHGADVLVAPLRPVTCDFQIRESGPDGREKVTCTLPPCSCPFQRSERAPDGRWVETCSQPHCVCMDWQVVELETLPSTAVRDYMTRDPVQIALDTPVRELARKMVEAQIHRLIVVDSAGRPLGIVTSTDLLAEVAFGPDTYSVPTTFEPSEEAGLVCEAGGR
jgi:CBS domain-containing protein